MVTSSDGDTFTVRELREIFNSFKADDDDLKVHFTVGNKDCVINASSYGVYLAGRRVEGGYFQLMGYAVETEEQKNERKATEKRERTQAQKQKANRINGQTPRWPAADQVPSQEQ